MRHLIIACLALGLLGCGSEGKNDKKEGKTDEKTAVVEVNPVYLKKKDFPAGIPFRGKIHESWQYTDNSGDHIFFTAEEAPHETKAASGDYERQMSAALYLYLLTKDAEGNYKQEWNSVVEEKGCEFDLTCAFVDSSMKVTDLDHNGIAEMTVMYFLACRSDVSPSFCKLEMREGNNKYILEGNSWLKASDEDTFTVTEQNVNLANAPAIADEYEKIKYEFGRYKDEKSFAQAPPAFLSFARSHWIQFIQEKLGE